LLLSTDFDDHGGRQGNTSQALAQWRHPVAFSVAPDVLHRAMRIASYRCIAMAIKTACNLRECFIIVDSVAIVAHNHS
jgi:hypothetical protein